MLSLVAVVFTLAIVGCQREGCTDPKATNYDSDAKKDNGTCVYQEPEQDSVIPTKEKTFDWDWRVETTATPTFDSLKKYVDDPTYKYVIMNMVNKNIDNPQSQDFGMEGSPCAGYRMRVFRRAKDSVYSVADKCNGKLRMSGKIIVNDVVPDSVQSGQAIWESDSADLTRMGVYILNARREYSNN